jgi:hypothetical protein
LCYVSVLTLEVNIDDLGGHQGNMVQALPYRRHPVASSEALDKLHQAMCPALYHRICMVIKIPRNSPAFFAIVDYLFAHNLR